ncbi:MAG TPA: winged helix-turn-helix domain-containing protein [Phycisphaerae bacterium]
MIYRFGAFEFDDRASILKRRNRLVAIEPQPARALALLLSRAGEVVTREELRAHLWGDDTHVDFDRGLAYCIGQLRASLWDPAETPRFVQTLPRRGFRFIAPVEKIDTDTPPAPARRFRKGNALAAALAVAVVLGGIGAWLMTRRPAASRSIVAVAVFENLTGVATLDRTVNRLSDVIVERLTALGPERLGVNGNAGILRRPRDARDGKAVATETGASFLVSGQLEMTDGQVSLLMQLIRLDDGTHVWVQRIARPAGDPLDTIDKDVALEVESAVRRLVLKDSAPVRSR